MSKWNHITGIYLRAILFTILIFKTSISKGQLKETGLPFISSYSRDDYNAESQNWAITQDENGVMYFGNNQGVLTFNGSKWSTNPLTNNSIVRALKYADGKVYAGGYNEFGYFKYDSIGVLHYTSLSNLLPESNKSFDEIWRIHETPYGIVFQSYYNLFVCNKTELKVFYPESSFGFSYMVNGELLIVDRKRGLLKFDGKLFNPIFIETGFFESNDITFIIPHNNELLLGTTNNGIFKLAGGRLQPWNVAVNDVFIKDQIYQAIQINGDQIAVGSIQHGIYIIDNNGNLILNMNRSNGMQNNTVLSVFSDRDNNLWLGLDNGIDMLEGNSPFSIFNYSYNIETAYTSIVHNNILYVGTNQGLFAKPLDEITNEFNLSKGFVRVSGTQGQVWKLSIFGGRLFCGHTFGTFIIDNYNAIPISDRAGGWDFQQVPWNSGFVIAGTYSGLNLYKRDHSPLGWENAGPFAGFNESSKELYFDKNNNLWISHGFKGIFKITFDTDLKKINKVVQFKEDAGLGKIPYALVKIKNEVLVLDHDKLYTYNYANNSFELSKLNELFTGIKEITRITEADNGDIWYFKSNGMGVLRFQEDGSYINIDKPFERISKLLLHGSFENIYTYKSQSFIGSDKGLLHYSTDTYKDYNQSFKTYFDEITIGNRKKDTISGSSSGNQLFLTLDGKDKEITYKFNSIKFKFYSPFYAPKNVSFSFRLVGFEEGWSDWSTSNYKEYTNLAEGDYTFEVKSLNIYNQESEVLQYHFRIKPPIYRTNVAYLLYLIFVVVIIVINAYYFKRKIERTRQAELLKHQEVLLSKEKAFKKEVQQNEERIEQLEKEKLKSEMVHKNMELANSTMSLINKNKFLTGLKRELTSMINEAKSQKVKTDLKKIIIRIDKDINNDQNFKVFDKYFDHVHQDFINRLKEKHDSLTPKDLRLCAYLRMNLSTKEIAPLMNVSIRGLEISRYRLRKKLDIEHDQNLVDYILEF